jgi:hypothetical protein
MGRQLLARAGLRPPTGGPGSRPLLYIMNYSDAEPKRSLFALSALLPL